jgi:hypothetical protein
VQAQFSDSLRAVLVTRAKHGLRIRRSSVQSIAYHRRAGEQCRRVKTREHRAKGSNRFQKKNEHRRNEQPRPWAQTPRQADKCLPTAVIRSLRAYKRAGEIGYWSIQAALGGRAREPAQAGSNMPKYGRANARNKRGTRAGARMSDEVRVYFRAVRADIVVSRESGNLHTCWDHSRSSAEG